MLGIKSRVAHLVIFVVTGNSCVCVCVCVCVYIYIYIYVVIVLHILLFSQLIGNVGVVSY